MASYTEISCTALARLIGTPNCPKIIDVCIPEDFAADPRIIPSSVKLSHTDLNPSQFDPDVPVVVVCQKGKKLSHGVAAILRQHNIKAEVLEGGVYAWRDAGLPMIAIQKLGLALPQSRWVTRHRPKIDRVACYWLIKRFIDRSAEFLFVPPTEVLAVADKFDANAIDVAGAPWTHQGDKCTFDALIQDFALDFPALNTMAHIVRLADTDRTDEHPVAAGHLAISLGLSRMFKDDIEQCQHGLTLYDALYRWARDAQTETHTSLQESLTK